MNSSMSYRLKFFVVLMAVILLVIGIVHFSKPKKKPLTRNETIDEVVTIINQLDKTQKHPK